VFGAPSFQFNPGLRPAENGLLEVEKLACTRGDRPLFRDLSFSLSPGELLHLQGANGSGKTTLLRTLCGLSRPSAGTIRWKGQPVQDDRAEFLSQLCYIGHPNALHGDLTGCENLDFEACLNSARSAARTALAEAGLGTVANLPTKLLSQGQKRRTALARLRVTTQPLWILDEPLTALDRRSTEVLQELFGQHLGRGGLIILTSHQDVSLADWPVLTLSLEGW
jgi:heme exporter protein A